jgi:hypothetical protein
MGPTPLDYVPFYYNFPHAARSRPEGKSKVVSRKPPMTRYGTRLGFYRLAFAL